MNLNVFSGRKNICFRQDNDKSSEKYNNSSEIRQNDIKQNNAQQNDIKQNDVFSGKNGLFFVSIGGSDEIGMNCILYICDEEILIVDLGIGFPDDMPGVQVIVPDLSFIFARKKQVVGLVITHIHEDHCGAMSYLLKYLPDLKIYATRFCINFVKAKLDENNHKEKVDFIQVADFEKIDLGLFNIEFVHLTHSTLEMMALLIKTKYATVFHTGDWKMDVDPVVGTPINPARLKQIGDDGVTAIICDSTNVMVQERSKSEGTLAPEFEKLIAAAKSRVIVTLFASNVGRMSTLFSIAVKLKKKICLVGRAVGRVYNAAKDSGYLTEFEDSLVIGEVEAAQYDPKEVIILCTGCQAEPLAALTKIVHGRHRHLKLLSTDTIIFSSKMIPGNEKRIYNIYNQIIKNGAILMTHDTHPVHVSGHPSAEELRDMYSYIRPQISVPVHGEDLHIHAHAKLAKSLGIKQVFINHNGDILKICPEDAGKVGEIKSGFLCVDGKLFRRAHDPVLKVRKKIMEDGVLVMFISFNKKDKTNPIRSSIFAPGLLDENNDRSILSDLVARLNKELTEIIQTDDRKNDISYSAWNIAKKFCKNRLGKDPVMKVNLTFDN